MGERSRLDGRLEGPTIPGNPSDVPDSPLAMGVGVGSTETTDLMGKTRSVAEGLIGPKGESDLEDGEERSTCCASDRSDLHGVRRWSESHKCCS